MSKKNTSTQNTSTSTSEIDVKLKYVLDTFKVTSEADVIKAKTSGDKQTRSNTAIETPTSVSMSAEECQKLCKEMKIPYVKGYEERILSYTCSDDSVDRMGDVIKQDGWDLENFKSNPVIMANHNYGEYPVGNALSVGVEGNKLKMKILFATEDVSKDADKAYRLAKAGFMKAGSVGFIPKQYRVPTKEEKELLGMKDFGMIFEKNELLEFSVCGVPANANAIQDSIKRGMLSKKDLELIYKSEEIESANVTEEDNTDTTNDSNNNTTNDTTVNVPEEEIAKAVAKYMQSQNNIVVKQGAVLSKKNKELINKVIGSMNDTITSLNELMKNAEANNDSDNNDVKEDKTKSSDSTIIDIDLDNIGELEEDEELYSNNVIEINI